MDFHFTIDGANSLSLWITRTKSHHGCSICCEKALTSGATSADTADLIYAYTALSLFHRNFIYSQDGDGAPRSFRRVAERSSNWGKRLETMKRSFILFHAAHAAVRYLHFMGGRFQGTNIGGGWAYRIRVWGTAVEKETLLLVTGEHTRNATWGVDSLLLYEMMRSEACGVPYIPHAVTAVHYHHSSRIAISCIYRKNDLSL